MDIGLLDQYGCDELGTVLHNSYNDATIKLVMPKGMLTSYQLKYLTALPTKESILTLNSLGEYGLIDPANLNVSVDFTPYLKKDGSILLESGYVPTDDYSIATRKFVLDHVGSGSGNIDLTPYVTKAEAASTYATQTALTGYLTKSEASANYAPIGSIPDITPYLTKTEAANTYLTSSNAGSTYLPIATAASTYQTIAGMSGYQPSGNALTALQSSWASDTSQENLVPKRSGNSITWVALPDTSNFVTSAQLSGVLKADGSVQIAGSFTPSNDRDLVYKAWVEQKIQQASIGGGGTAPDLSTYLLKTEAASTYQPLGTALTALQSSWSSGTTDNLKIPQRQGTGITWINLPDLTSYLTSAIAASTYQPKSTVLDTFANWFSNAQTTDGSIPVKSGNTLTSAKLPDLSTYLLKTEAATSYQPLGSALTALQNSWQTGSSQDGKIPQRQGNNLIWIDTPTGGTGGTVDLTPYLLKVDAAATYALKTQIPDLSTYLSKTEAASTYALKTQIPDLSTYLTISNAGSTYLSKADAASGYLTKSDAATTYLTAQQLDNRFSRGDQIIELQDKVYTVGDMRQMKVGEIYHAPVSAKTSLAKLFNVAPIAHVTVVADDSYLVKISPTFYVLYTRFNSPYDASFRRILYTLNILPTEQDSAVIGSKVDLMFVYEGNWINAMLDTTYLKTSDAIAQYQAKGAALTALQASWASDASQDGKIPQRSGNTITWITPPTGGTGGTVDLTNYYTKSEGDARYMQSSAYPELIAFGTTAASANNGQIPRKQGNSFTWVALPTTPDLSTYATISYVDTNKAPITEFNSVKNATEHLWSSAVPIINLEDKRYTVADLRLLKVGFVYAVPEATGITDPVDNAVKNRAKLKELFNIDTPFLVNSARLIKLNQSIYYINCRTFSSTYLTSKGLMSFNYFLEVGAGFVGSSPVGGDVDLLPTFQIAGNWLLRFISAGSIVCDSTYTPTQDYNLATKKYVDGIGTTLQGMIPDTTALLTKTEAVASYVQKVAFDPVKARTDYLTVPKLDTLADQQYVVQAIRTLDIGTTYKFPKDTSNYDKIKDVLGFTPIGNPTDATLQRITRDTYLLTYSASGTRVEQVLTLTESVADLTALGSTTSTTFRTLLTSASASLENSIGRFSSLSKTNLATTYTITNQDAGKMINCSNACVVTIGQEMTGTGQENTVFKKDDEIGLYGSGGAITLNVSGAAQINDSQTAIVIPRYTGRVLKRFDLKDKWYLL